MILLICVYVCIALDDFIVLWLIWTGYGLLTSYFSRPFWLGVDAVYMFGLVAR